MTIQTTAHLNFRGEARGALEFYRSVFGGELAAITYADAGAVSTPAEADQIMWGQVAAENGFRVMAYDVPASRPWSPGDAPFFMSVRGKDAGEVETYWNGLAAGATVIQPIGASGWSPLYGMLRDKFGVTWVLDVEVAYGG